MPSYNVNEQYESNGNGASTEQIPTYDQSVRDEALAQARTVIDNYIKRINIKRDSINILDSTGLNNTSLDEDVKTIINEILGKIDDLLEQIESNRI